MTLTLATLLLALLIAAKAGYAGVAHPRSGVAHVWHTGGIPDRLARDARYLATHGGVTGSCHGCATDRMKQLVRWLIIARFQDSGPQAVRTALCVVAGESGFNPGAISQTGDYGVFQINRLSWEHAYDWSRILDPVYNVGVGWAMSRRGFSWSPWVVWTSGRCS